MECLCFYKNIPLHFKNVILKIICIICKKTETAEDYLADNQGDMKLETEQLVCSSAFQTGSASALSSQLSASF